jgi:bisphosphoglycerate-independent phosphoglycerate mutase (AlkP superfamily)
VLKQVVVNRQTLRFQAVDRSFQAQHHPDRRLLVAAEQTRRERWIPATQKAARALTYFISPFVKRPLYVAEQPSSFKVESGILADVSPTLLFLLDLKQPAEMTGRNLVDSRQRRV